MIWCEEKLSVVYSPVNNCSTSKKRSVSFIPPIQVIKKQFISSIQSDQNHGDRRVIHLHHPPQSKIHATKGSLCVCCNQGSIIYHGLLNLDKTIIEKQYWTQLWRMSRAWNRKMPQWKKRPEKEIQKHETAVPYVANPVLTIFRKGQMKILTSPAVFCR